ncbi:hypothetical protein AB0C52_25025 [Streptomyces sp. NPDC048717]|uniref:hypothetical protein n=1 Tax=Streptomyces sp. NPDC048717 TaxID=3154928 RepID=UPI0034458C4B
MPLPRPLPDTDRDRELESFATVLADLLPGRWTVEHHRHRTYEDQAEHAADVWDLNDVAAAIAEYELGEDAHLVRADGTRLYVTLRPLHEEFLVAAIAPGIAPEAFAGVREPDGIAVPADPELAARAIDADLLPRYDIALAQVRHNAMNPPQPAPSPDAQVVMTWNEDGSLTATTTAQPAAEILIDEGFTRKESSAAYVLAGDDTRAQGRAVQTAAARLARLGIGTVLRSAPRSGVDAALPAAPARARTAPARGR